MQELSVISINLWDVLISLANLVVLYFVMKKFLYKPVKRVLAEREEKLANQYRAADEAVASANAARQAYDEKLAHANTEADNIISEATASASRRSEKIVADARSKADEIIRQGELEAEMEKKKAQETIRREITEVSAAMAEKLLMREMDTNDHRQMIDEFLKDVGED